MATKQDKHAGGRPLVFKTVPELEAKVAEYFDYCDNRAYTKFDPQSNKEIVVTHPAPYTMSGLARYLGIDRRSLLNYADRDKFLPTIKQARARVEEDIETRLLESRTPVGAIFNLKNNFGWIDETKQHLDGEFTSKNELSPEAAAILAKASRSNDGATESD